MSAGHGHGHGHGAPTSRSAERALTIALVLNAVFLVIEAVAGWLTGSLALLSDAGHMLSDVGALAVALVAQRIATRRPSPRYTFGLRRAPVIGGLANALSLVVIVVLVIVEATERFESPPALDPLPVFGVGLAGLVVNVVAAWILARSNDRSVNIRGAILHLAADALGSVAAVISAGCVFFWGLYIADPIASVVIALLIVVSTVPLLRETVAILLQRAPAGLEMAAIESLVTSVPRVAELKDLHVWELDSGQAVLTVTVTVRCATVDESTAIADAIRARLLETHRVGHATIECRPVSAPDPTPAECR